MATHSSTLAWQIPWTEEPGGLQSLGSLGVGHDWATSFSCIGEGNGNPLQCSFLENSRDGGAWGVPSMGSHRVGHDWSDLAAAAAFWNTVFDLASCPLSSWSIPKKWVIHWPRNQKQREKRASNLFVCVCTLSRVRLFATPWTVASQL